MTSRAIRLLRLVLVFGLWNPASITAVPTPSFLRLNTTAHLIFNTVSSLLQHWPNTIYRNGHTFVPAIIPAGTLLHHSRTSYDPPPSPEFFAFDLEHAYLFCFYAPCLMFNYATTRDLRVGYFDGTSAATLGGPRDFQDILFNDGFIPGEEYDPWTHAANMCSWANKVGLDGIVRMEPSFETILCNIDNDLTLVSKLELVYPESVLFPGKPMPRNFSSINSRYTVHPRLRRQQPYLPPPTMPVYPPPPGWKGKQRNHPEISYESIRAGMWHNHSPGENRIILDYTRIVSAYDDAYASLVVARRGLHRSQHRLNDISSHDQERLQAEVHEVLTQNTLPSKVDWKSLFQTVIDRHSERLEDLRYVLRLTGLDPVEAVANVRHKVLIALSPFMVLPRANSGSTRRPIVQGESAGQINFDAGSPRSEPDSDWMDRIYHACADSATAAIRHTGSFNSREQKLISSIDRVQGAICSSLVSIWATAFDSESKSLFARRMIAAWRVEVEQLMEWLDWHMWVKCDPPCKPGMQCVLATWPWEVQSGDEDVGPTCRDQLILY